MLTSPRTVWTLGVGQVCLHSGLHPCEFGIYVSSYYRCYDCFLLLLSCFRIFIYTICFARCLIIGSNGGSDTLAATPGSEAKPATPGSADSSQAHTGPISPGQATAVMGFMESLDASLAGEKKQAQEEQCASPTGANSSVPAVGSSPAAGVSAPQPPPSCHSSQGLSAEQLANKRASRMVKSFVASFRNGAVMPPCRSYRNFMALSEFSVYFERIAEAKTEADIKNVKDEMKPFKAALNDLVTQSRNASVALCNALKGAKKSAQGFLAFNDGLFNRFYVISVYIYIYLYLFIYIYIYI